ncbi:MAG: response regulator [Deltaproteobacteria bacterium]|nr:response regulator [Deltaproteobacteria bacterium]
MIDDDDDFGRVVSSMLVSNGIEAWSLSDASRSWEILEARRPDLVLVDVLMPNVSGFDLCRALRASPEWRDVPVLFVTAATDPSTRAACFDAGGDDYLSKPVVESGCSPASVFGWSAFEACGATRTETH